MTARTDIQQIDHKNLLASANSNNKQPKTSPPYGNKQSREAKSNCSDLFKKYRIGNYYVHINRCFHLMCLMCDNETQ